MSDAEKLAHCVGCRDNLYNDKTPSSGKRCWSFGAATLERRFETGTWTDPTTPGAFTEVEVHHCYNAADRHFSRSLPACAVDPVRLDGVKMLWVDDVKPALAGCVVARTYEEALEKLRGERWDVLYLDYDLGAPGCNGVNLLDEMAEHDIPIPASVRSISGSPFGSELIRATVEKYRTSRRGGLS